MTSPTPREGAARPEEEIAQELLSLHEATTGGEWQDYFTDRGRQHIVSHTEEGTLKLFSAMKDSGPVDAGFACWARNFGPELAQAYLDALEEIAELRAYRKAIGYVRSLYPESVFLPDSDSVDARSADMARRTCDNIEREAERMLEPHERKGA